MSDMTYKGYAARVEYDAQDKLFVGHLAGIRDIIGFHGKTVAQLERAFREAVDDYLATCGKLGQEPDKPFSGRLLVRVAPELHARASSAARRKGVSLNQWVAQTLERAVEA